MSKDTPEEMAECLAMILDGSMGLTLTEMQYKVAAMDGLPEFYVRNSSGELFRYVCESVGDDEFNPFADEDA